MCSSLYWRHLNNFKCLRLTVCRVAANIQYFFLVAGNSCVTMRILIAMPNLIYSGQHHLNTEYNTNQTRAQCNEYTPRIDNIKRSDGVVRKGRQTDSRHTGTKLLATLPTNRVADWLWPKNPTKSQIKIPDDQCETQKKNRIPVQRYREMARVNTYKREIRAKRFCLTFIENIAPMNDRTKNSIRRRCQ